MMHRYIRRIPRVNLSGGFALGRALLVATDLVPRLSEPILRARRLLENRLDNLAARLPGHDVNPQNERTSLALAGRTLDAGWVALHDWLEAMAALPAHQEAARTAVELLIGIFPHGMALVRPPPLLEWAESEARLARIDKDGFEPTLWALGGKPFVETIRSAHAHYANLLSHTESGAWSSRVLKQCLDGVVYAIHAYVALELLFDLLFDFGAVLFDLRLAVVDLCFDFRADFLEFFLVESTRHRAGATNRTSAACRTGTSRRFRCALVVRFALVFRLALVVRFAFFTGLRRSRSRPGRRGQDGRLGHGRSCPAQRAQRTERERERSPFQPVVHPSFPFTNA